MELNINEFNKDIIKKAKMESIIKFIGNFLYHHPKRIELLKILDDYMEQTKDVYDIINLEDELLEPPFSEDKLVEKIRGLEFLLKKEEPTILTPYHKLGIVSGMTTATLQYLKIRFSNSPITIEEELIEQMGVYLEYLSVDELEDTQKSFFKCTDDRELYDLVISKLGI
mgnify:CR=1 FL=1